MATLLATRQAWRTAAALLVCAAAAGASGQTTTRYESWSAEEGAGGAHVSFVVFQGDRDGPGYRLAYNPGHEPALELLRAGSYGVSVIEAHPAALGEGEVPKRIEWTREASGDMVVSVDGEVLIRALDRGLRDPFDGFAITNLGGDFAVREVAIAGVEPGS